MSPITEGAPDFGAETFLEPAIQYPHPIVKNIAAPNKIFLTGATGLLGANLLDEFLRNTRADVYCLVRGHNADDGKQRLKQQLQFYALWQNAFESRIIPVVGDLEQPRLGLSEMQFHAVAEQIDVIYHSAAVINVLYSYKRLKAANVLVPQDVLRLAGLYRTKPVHYISSLSVFSGGATHYPKKRIVLETDDPAGNTNVKGGYVQTKLVSEQLVRSAQKRGLPACIYRAGRIMGHSKTGIMGNLSDLICILWRGCLLVNRFPTVDTRLSFVPVDFASQAIGHLSRQSASFGKAFHIHNSQSMAWTDIFDTIRASGYPLKAVSYSQWLEAIEQQAPTPQDKDNRGAMEMQLLSSSALTAFSPKPTFDIRQTLEGLTGTSIVCPPVDAGIVRVYISYFQKSGFFPAPSPSNIVEYWRARKRLTPETLEPAIQYPHPIVKNIAAPNKIFLTGATGLLGVNLLDEFLRNTRADVYCLVRGHSADGGKRRLKQQLQFYALWQNAFESRIIPVIGDLEQPRLGLSEIQFHALAEQIDVIYHSAAVINVLYSNRRLKAANVLSTQDVLRLAGLYRTKPVHYISSLSVFSGGATHYPKKRIVLETDDPAGNTNVKGGYVQTKLVSEQLVRSAQKRGLPACIYRAGRIMGHSKTGIMGNLSDLICILWRGCLLVNRFPTVDTRLSFVPVDFASQAIGHLSRQSASFGKAFHIHNSQSMAWTAIFDTIRTSGYPLKAVSYSQWLEAIERQARTLQDEDNKGAMEMQLLSSSALTAFSPEPTFDIRQTLAGLTGTSIVCPPVDAGIVRAYISYFQKSGFFPDPSPSNKVEYWRARKQRTLEKLPSQR